ncbi:glycosyl hydrolase family 3 N terminal domain-containing protein [Aspergillus aurantiobrunneus]
MALEAELWTAMVSYPKINRVPADMSSFILQKLLRAELRFDRLVMSDWGGCNSTVESLVASTDLEMPGPSVRRGERLLNAICKAWAALLPSLEQINGHSEALTQSVVNAEELSSNPSTHQIIQEAAEAGLVLLKNKALLPLQPSSLKKIASWALMPGSQLQVARTVLQ